MDSKKSLGQLYRLARLYNVQTAFYGMRRYRHTAAADSLLTVLPALDAPVASLSDVDAALRERTQAKWRQIVEPVTVVWDGAQPVINITLPAGIADAPGAARLELESGEISEWKFQLTGLPVIESTEVEGCRYTTRKLTLPEGLPYGYHQLILQTGGKSCVTMIISAPRRAFSPPDKNARGWGAFLPLYALKTAHDWGGGDYSGLSALVDWVAGEGGDCVGTLPLLPVFLDKPFDPSPYAPVSRLLWNEFYVDVNNIPELAQCPPALELLHSAPLAAEIARSREKSLVDYRGIISLKRGIMEQLSKHVIGGTAAPQAEFRRFVRENPLVVDYARFRGVMEKQGKSWGAWPPRLRDGEVQQTDYEEDVKNYHLYAQWQARRQVDDVAEKARRKGVRLYFDLPVGVHPDGYDVWRHRGIFPADIAVGAPPDPVFTTGQNWGFPPLHPEKIRAQGYRYVRDYLGHHLRHAAMLRIDHVMGLHRLYWIPRGMEATRGVYVRYHAEELYAILAVESHRHRSVIVGEDLGIVPGYVRPSMARHGLHRMYILYFELADSGARTPRPIPRNSIAALNTHDMPPFAAFWEDTDIRENVRLGLLDKKESATERKDRRATKKALTAFLRDSGFLGKTANSTRSAFKACLAYLSASAAHTVLLNLEDLWQETLAQNMPGAGTRFPSWRRKARYKLEEFCCLSVVGDILKEIKKKR